jgi:hypothetical protein
MSDKNSPDENQGLRFWEVMAIICYAIGAIGIAVYAGGQKTYLQTFGVLLLVATAAWLAGGVLGFLFGVPRLRASSGGAQAATGASTFVPNTNLEQISDWLTKVIVGATLVQLGPLVDRFAVMAQGVGSSLGTPSAVAVSAGVMIYYFCAGFMWGYLWCSLRVFKEMSALTDREKNVRTLEAKPALG